jgi:hypothetical protein
MVNVFEEDGLLDVDVDVDVDVEFDADEFVEEDDTLVGEFLQREQNDEQQAKFWINQFFQNKQMHYGGSIPKVVLYSPAYVDMVMDYNVCDGVHRAYWLIEHVGGIRGINVPPEEKTTETDIYIVIKLLRECHETGVPKYFAAGLVLMALELCYGITPPPNKIVASAS